MELEDPEENGSKDTVCLNHQVCLEKLQMKFKRYIPVFQRNIFSQSSNLLF